MITAINESNYNSYNALFEKATNLLKNLPNYEALYPYGVAINSLEDYFCLIEDLVEYGGKQYTILPLDEECFEIKANERIIQIPEAFRKNGIAVQGDEVAEIIYFKIDRYFDFVDLNNTDIYIQWQSLSTSENIPPSGISREWVRDIESEPGQLIFGWPLDSSITSVSGPIKFSVRFVMWERDEEGNIITPKNIVYSLSTLDAQATINPAIDRIESDLAVAADTVSDFISKRIKNSIKSGGATTPKQPRFLLGLPLQEIDLNVSTDEQGKTHYTYAFKVQADTNGDTGMLSYAWKKEKNGVYEDLDDANSSIEYLLSEDETAKADSVYYERGTNGYITVALDVGTNLKTGYDDQGKPINDKYYEKFNVYNIDVIGTGRDAIGNYYVVATTSKGIAPAPTASAQSGPARIPAPLEANIEVEKTNGYILQYDNEAQQYSCTLTANVEVTDENKKDLLASCSWLKDNVELAAESYDKTNEVTIEHTIVSSEIDKTLQGEYILQATTLRNGVTTDSNSSFFVTYPAMIPQLSYDSNSTANDGDVAKGTKISVEVNFVNDYQNGLNTPSYQWYKVLDKTNVCDATVEEIKDENNQPVKTKEIDTSNYNGYLTCKVTNSYNGDIAYAYSAPVGIVG